MTEVRRLGRSPGLHGLMAAALAWTVLLRFLAPAQAATEDCPLPAAATANLAAQPRDSRLRFLRQSLADTARLERHYALGWSLAYLGMAAGSWVLVPFDSNPQEQSKVAAWNSATSVAAGLLVLIDPVRVIRDHQKLERLLARPEGATTSCAVVAEAERLLKRVADNQTAARSPRAHVLSTLGTVGLGLILGYALQHPDAAAQDTTIGVILGELMIATRPTLAIRRLEQYKAGKLDLTERSPIAESLRVSPLVLRDAHGVALSFNF